MPALQVGRKAPGFTLPTTDGEELSLQEALARGPVVLAFMKISCPVCQYAFPFFERLYQANRNGRLTVFGISQNDEDGTEQFMRTFGVTFPVLLDDPETYPVSNAYGITNVPTMFLIAPDGTIELASVGWNKKDVEAVSRRLAHDGMPPASVFHPGEHVVDSKAG